MQKRLLAKGIVLSLAVMSLARAGTDETPAEAGPAPDTSNTLSTIEVNAKLDTARNQLSPETGASQYVISPQAIDQLPLLFLAKPGIAPVGWSHPTMP